MDIPNRMLAMVFEGAHQPLRARDVPVPQPEPDQVLIKVGACGVCRTDLHILDGELSDPKLPLVPGHQIVGRVVAAQFPDLTDLPVSAFTSTGTVNGIYRSGDHLDARLPRVQKWAQALDRECLWLPKLAPRLVLHVPSRWARDTLLARTPSRGRFMDGSTASRTPMSSLTITTRRPRIWRSSWSSFAG